MPINKKKMVYTITRLSFAMIFGFLVFARFPSRCHADAWYVEQSQSESVMAMKMKMYRNYNPPSPDEQKMENDEQNQVSGLGFRFRPRNPPSPDNQVSGLGFRFRPRQSTFAPPHPRYLSVPRSPAYSQARPFSNNSPTYSAPSPETVQRCRKRTLDATTVQSQGFGIAGVQADLTGTSLVIDTQISTFKLANQTQQLLRSRNWWDSDMKQHCLQLLTVQSKIACVALMTTPVGQQVVPTVVCATRLPQFIDLLVTYKNSFSKKGIPFPKIPQHFPDLPQEEYELARSKQVSTKKTIAKIFNMMKSGAPDNDIRYQINQQRVEQEQQGQKQLSRKCPRNFNYIKVL